MMFPDFLRNGIWHTTSVDRFNAIVRSGSISPDPPIPDSDRWSTGNGPDSFPYVRVLGGVSIFDFTDFDEIHYGANYPASPWYAFVPCLDKWEASIWIELDRELLGDAFISGAALMKRWEVENAFRNKIMPLIEGAHIGPIPISAFLRVFRYCGEQWHQIGTVAEQ
jgi:hypothetical protein